MIKKRYISASLAVPAAILMLAGCSIQEGAETSEHYPNTHYTFVQELPDGGSVLCAWAKSGYGGGLSCDWANKTAPTG